MQFIKDVYGQIFSQSLDVITAYFLCLVAGILVNWIWKCKRENIHLLKYWTENPGFTVLSILGAVAAFFTTMIVEPGLGKQTYFAMGIACDSLLNKPPLPLSVQKALADASEGFVSKNLSDLTSKEQA